MNWTSLLSRCLCKILTYAGTVEIILKIAGCQMRRPRETKKLRIGFRVRLVVTGLVDTHANVRHQTPPKMYVRIVVDDDTLFDWTM